MAFLFCALTYFMEQQSQLGLNQERMIKYQSLSVYQKEYMNRHYHDEIENLHNKYYELIESCKSNTIESLDNEDSINTLSELVAYLEKKGFVLNYRINENRDIDKEIISNENKKEPAPPFGGGEWQ